MPDRTSPVDSLRPRRIAYAGVWTTRAVVASLALVATVSHAAAGLRIWDGGGNGSSWNDPANWAPNGIPGAADDVVIQAARQTVIYGGTSSVATLTLGPGQTLHVRGAGDMNNAVLTVLSSGSNAGTILLESANSSYNSSLLLGDSFTNLAGGTIQSNLGAGGVRTISGGTLVNAGLVAVASNAYLTISTGYTIDGGRLEGPGVVSNAAINVTQSPALPSTVVCVGTGNVLESENLPNVELWVQGNGAFGNALLSIADGVVNNGTIRFQSVNSSYTSGAVVLSAEGVAGVVPGEFVNGRDGLIVAAQGSGGVRSITGSLTNLGTVRAETGVLLSVIGAEHVFTQAGGLVEGQGTGEVRNQGGTLLLTGGQSLGNVAQFNGALDIAATVTLPSVVQSLGSGSTLVGNDSQTTMIWVRGRGDTDNAFLTTLPGAVNAGVIRLQSTNSSYNSSLVLGDSFTNLAGGTIQSNLGSGGFRTISGGTLVNAGLVDVAGDAYLTISTGYTIAGGRLDGPGVVSNAAINVMQSPALPNTVVCVGLGNVLQSDNLPNVELWVRGDAAFNNALLAVADGVVNDGSIRLQSITSSYTSAVVVLDPEGAAGAALGEFINGSNGLIVAAQGSGGLRSITGSVTNLGTMRAEPGVLFTLLGTDHVFTQAGGLVEGEGSGEIRSQGGTVLLTGGQSVGNVSQFNGAIDVAATVTLPSIVQAQGVGSTLIGNDSQSTVIWVRGRGDTNNAALTTLAGAVNAGVIRLESSDSGYSSLVSITESLANMSTGTIRSNLGSGGPRTISGGTLVNAGLVDVATNAYLTISTGYTIAGGRLDGPGVVSNAAINVTQSPALPNTVVCVGSGNVLQSDNLPNVELWVRGDGSFNNALLSIVDGAVNNGAIRLESINSGYTSRIAGLDGAAVVNGEAGRIEARPGTGGPRTVNGTLVNNGALYAGYPNSLTVTGDYIESSSAVYEAEFAGAGAGQRCRMSVLGVADLAGAVKVSRVDGFIPAPGSDFSVLVAGTMIPAWGQIVSCDPTNISYTATDAIVTFGFLSGILGDLTGDGSVDGADLGLLLAGWGDCNECCPGDLDESGFVDGSDLGVLLSNWG